MSAPRAPAGRVVMKPMIYQPFVNSVAHERGQQDAKWGLQRHGWGPWGVILGEEYGEVCQELVALEFHETFGAEDIFPLSCARQELIQLAAVACAMIEQLDEHIARAKETKTA